MDTFKIGENEEDINDVLGTYYTRRTTHHFCMTRDLVDTASPRLFDFIGLIQTREELTEELRKYQGKKYSVLAVNDVIAICETNGDRIDLYCNAISKEYGRKMLFKFFALLGKQVGIDIDGEED